MALTNKQKKFCKEYIKDYNATQAALRAGYAEKYADRQGYNLVVNNRVKDEIGRLEAKKEAKVEHSRDVSLSNLQDAYDIAKSQGNVSAMVAAEREKNAISGLHSITNVNKGEALPKLDEATKAALAELARPFKLKLAKGR